MERTNITILQVPEDYQKLYTWFQTKIIDFGMNLVEECDYYTTKSARKLLSCWTMFQASCFAYYNDEEKKSKFLYNYIVKDLKLENYLNSTDSDISDPTNPDDEDETPMFTIGKIRVSSGVITESVAIEKEFDCTPDVIKLEFTSDSEWCHVSPHMWTGEDKVVRVWVDENENLSSRKATISVKINNSTTTTFNIIQEANPNNLNWS